VSSFTLDRLERVLSKKTAPSKINVCLCHHHPQKHDELELGDYDDMQGGQRLLDLLGSGEFGEWLVVHGHKHHPKLVYSQGGATAPPVLSAGSLSAFLPPKTYGSAANQFYVVEFDEQSIHDFGLVGLVRAWDWDFGNGVRAATGRSGIPSTCGFGYRIAPREFAKRVSVYRQSRPPGSRGRDRSREGGEQMRGLGADLRRRWVVD
jgi:hypothetical protein